MDGRLWLADSSEAGSAFVISLPLAAGAEHTEPERNMLGQTVLIASPSQFEAPYIGESLPPGARLLSVPGVNPRRSRSSKGRVRLPTRF
jgi:hypothetical protein